jgi:hypothetical protein
LDSLIQGEIHHMLNDVLAGIPAAQLAIDDDPTTWVCLGLVDSLEDVSAVEISLGSRFEVICEPYAESVAYAAGWPSGRATLSYEVWARRA